MIRQIAPIFFTMNIPAPNPDKYSEELLDAYSLTDDLDALYNEYAGKDAEFTRGLAHMPWGTGEFIVKDCDGPLLAFGSNH